MPEFDGTLAQFLDLTRAIYPGCRICEDGDGQIVIYTGATTEMGGQVVQWEPDDEDRYREWCEQNPEVCACSGEATGRESESEARPCADLCRGQR